MSQKLYVAHSNAPERLWVDPEKATAYLVGASGMRSEFFPQWDAVLAAYPALSHYWNGPDEGRPKEADLPERDRAIITCWRWGMASKRVSKFVPCPQEKERSGVRDLCSIVARMARPSGGSQKYGWGFR